MDLYDRVGVGALGSRLRRLGDRLAEDAAKVYDLFGLPIQPRWYPVLQTLADCQSESVSKIAEEIGQSHASVSQIAKEMERAGVIFSAKGEVDTRKSYLGLSETGLALVPRLREQMATVGVAARKLVDESQHNLWLALADCERALDQTNLLERVRSEKARSDAERIEIIGFRPDLAEAFYRLNEEWITHYFEMEDSDRKQLLNPIDSIIEPGGDILFAMIGEDCVGTCALVPHGDGCLELAKMAIVPNRRGLKLGRILGTAAIDRAKEMGAKRLYLESNRGLVPAIRLYRSLGFVEVVGGASPYARADIQMELFLD